MLPFDEQLPAFSYKHNKNCYQRKVKRELHVYKTIKTTKIKLKDSSLQTKRATFFPINAF
jgi:hypothetical protein